MNKIARTETGHGTGYVHKRLPRFLRPKLHKLVFKSAPVQFDWQNGYSVEKEIGTKIGNADFKLPVKDQGQSDSCGGQTAATLQSINEALLRGTFVEYSARDGYSHMYLMGGGTTSPRLQNVMLHRGIAKEALVPSYENGNPPSENFMRTPNDTPEVIADAYSTMDTYQVSVDFSSIDSLAQGLQTCKGIAVAFEGKNNGTWLSLYPKPPVPGETDVWAHFWTGISAALDQGQVKSLTFLNSWGKDTGLNGRQIWYEDYVKSGRIRDAFGVIDDSLLAPLSKQQKIQVILIALQSAYNKLSYLLSQIAVLLRPQ